MWDILPLFSAHRIQIASHEGTVVTMDVHIRVPPGMGLCISTKDGSRQRHNLMVLPPISTDLLSVYPPHMPTRLPAITTISRLVWWQHLFSIVSCSPPRCTSPMRPFATSSQIRLICTTPRLRCGVPSSYACTADRLLNKVEVYKHQLEC